MLSNSCPQDGKNFEHNVFGGICIRPKQDVLFSDFLREQDISPHTAQALIMDVRKFAKWFSTANAEPWDVARVTVRDIADFRGYLHREKKQANSTVNRCLASLRKYFKWLSNQGHVVVNPTTGVKELRRQQLAPQGLTRAEVRKLLREVELRNDIRAKAIFSLALYSGPRLSDITFLELSDLSISERSGTVFYIALEPFSVFTLAISRRAMAVCIQNLPRQRMSFKDVCVSVPISAMSARITAKRDPSSFIVSLQISQIVGFI